MAVYEFFQETAVGGLCYIRKDKPKFLQLFWLIVFLVGLGAIGRSFFISVQNFMALPTSTEYIVVSQSIVELPRIIICAGNRFNESRIRKLNLSSDLVTALNHNIINFKPGPLVPEMLKEEELVEILEKTQKEYKDLREKLEIKHYAQLLDMLYSKCEDIVKQCTTLRGREPLPCCESAVLFERGSGPCVFLPQYNQSERHNMIEILLEFPNVKDLSPALDQLTDDFTIRLASGDEYRDASQNEAAAVARGSYTRLVLEKVSFEAANNPPEYVCKNVKPHEQYNQISCKYTCIFGNLPHSNLPCQVKFISGRKIGSYSPDHQTICDPWTLLNLTIGAGSSQKHTFTPELIAECNRRCPQPCFQETVAVSYRQLSKLSKQILGKLWNDEIKAQHIAENYAVLVMGLERLQQRKIRQYFSFTLEMLVGQLGGFLGLFLGGSLISLVHVAVFMIQPGLCRARKAETVSDGSPTAVVIDQKATANVA